MLQTVCITRDPDNMPLISNLYYFAGPAENQDLNRPPVILLHGAGGDHLSWPPQIRRLEGWSVFAPDLPGHGKSEGAGRHSVTEYAVDVIAFLDALQIRQAVIVGISMGSAIALQLALKYPERVAGLGLFGGGPKMRVAPAVLETAGNENTFESAVDMINENCFSVHAPKNLVQLSKKRMMNMRPAVLLGDFLACNEFDVTGHLGQIDHPALIMCGAGDRMMPIKFSEALRDGIANSQLCVLENAGHMVMLEQTDSVVELLQQFLVSLAPRLKKTRKKRVKLNPDAGPAQPAESA
jgi:pimeloyl-ACP methyl ester carboxylesterase